jgi:hypothetical protein
LYRPSLCVDSEMLKAVFLLLILGSSVQAITEAELQTHIDTAIQAGGGEVVIPPAEVIITRGLLVENAKNLRIIGYDAERSILKSAPGAKVSLLTLKGTATNVRIEKLVFDGGDKTDAVGTTLLDLILSPEKQSEGQGIRVERCIFQNAAGIGIHGSGIARSQIQMCTFMDLGSVAVRLDGGSKAVTVADSHMARCTLAVDLVQTEDCTVTGIEARACGIGIGVGKSARGIQLSRNALDP